MEDVFIQKVIQLTEQLLKGEVTPESLIPELENHLKKARQMKFGSHEAETLHTIGVAHQFMGKIDTALDYYKMAIEKAETLKNPDLICKFCTNIIPPLQSKGNTLEALTYANKGIAIAESHHLKTMHGLPLYIAKGILLAFIGHYANADITLSKAWEIANELELKNYSRFEFAASTFHIHLAWLYISIYNRDEKRYQGYLAYTHSLAEHLKSYDAELAVCELIHAIVLTQDDDTIHTYEQKLIGIQGGVISLENLRNLTVILTHNHCHTWAKKYAQQILDRTQDDPHANAKLIEHAQSVLAGTFS